MNKADLAQKLSEQLELPRRTAEDFLNAFLEIITDQLRRGEEVNLTGFGSFKAGQRAARMGVNPQNPSQKIKIAAVVVPKFKPGKGLKDALKAGKK